MTNRLQNMRVMVTRPVDQAVGLIEEINAAGGKAFSFPSLVIQANVDAESAERCKFISGYDWVIFISQNAVRYSLSLLPITDWPTTTAIAAIGTTTANALQQAGLGIELQPEQTMNSEALLEKFSAEQINEKKILIVRGAGGREKLAEDLRAMGGLVDYAEVYTRSCPETDTAGLIENINKGIAVITIASGETLKNLASIIENSELSLEQKQKLYGCPLIVVSKRIRTLAEQLGFSDTIIVANKPDNAGLVHAIIEWQNT